MRARKLALAFVSYRLDIDRFLFFLDCDIVLVRVFVRACVQCVCV